jgi:ArsR family transcriptional regulator
VNRELYEHRASIVKALAHASRLMMVDALTKGERCVCELQEIVGADMSTVSRHLAVLRAAGLVTMRKEGLQVFYSLRCPCINDFLACVDEVVKVDAQQRERLAGMAR